MANQVWPDERSVRPRGGTGAHARSVAVVRPLPGDGGRLRLGADERRGIDTTAGRYQLDRAGDGPPRGGAVVTTDRPPAADNPARPRAEAAPIIAEQFHADEYELVRVERVSDGYGGWTETETVVESGRCFLDTSGAGREVVGGSVVEAISPYTAELPYDSAVSETDTLVINGRPFDITSVVRGGDFAVFTEVWLEARA